MTRLFLALALVSQLSGIAGAAAVVCQVEEGRPTHSCCCSHDSDAASAPVPGPRADTRCPCTMAPAVPSPMNQAPATTTTPCTFAGSPAVVPAVWHLSPANLQARINPHLAPVDIGPPPISASHLRC